jgi:outer membrane protein TolC
MEVTMYAKIPGPTPRVTTAFLPFLVGTLFLIGTPPASAQPLTLQDCIDRALAHNLEHRQNRHDLERARTHLQDARAPFEISANAGMTLPRYQETRQTLDDPALTSRVRNEEIDFSYAGNLNLAQRVRYLGRFALETTATRQERNSNRREGFLDYRGDMVFSYSRQILTEPSEEIDLRQAKFAYAKNLSQYDNQRLFTEKRATVDYFGLVQSIRRLDIEQQSLEQSRISFELAQRKFEIGLIAEVEALKLKVALLDAEASYAAAETAIESRRDVLRQTLGLEIDDPLEVDTDVEYVKFAIDEDHALQLALRRNTALSTLDLDEEIGALGLKNMRQTQGPKAQVNANVGLRGQGPDVGDISQNLERNLWNVWINVEVPLVDNGWRRNQVNRARVDLENTRLDKTITRRRVTADLRNIVRGLAQIERQIDLANSRIEVAERTYDVQQQRFEIGQADSQELLDSEKALTLARNDALNHVIAYQSQLVDLRLVTMSDLAELVEVSSE